MFMLADPQTSGGLLIASAADGADEVGRILTEHAISSTVIGRFETRDPAHVIRVE
jgi:selenophosphate synthase